MTRIREHELQNRLISDLWPSRPAIVVTCNSARDRQCLYFSDIHEVQSRGNVSFSDGQDVMGERPLLAKSRPPVLPRQPHINILHVIIRIDGFEEGFDFFTFGIVAEGDGIFGAVANHCGGDDEALCG